MRLRRPGTIAAVRVRCQALGKGVASGFGCLAPSLKAAGEALNLGSMAVVCT